jgi:hypothetical protein
MKLEKIPGKSRFEIPFSNLTILHFLAFLAGVWASSSSSRVALAKTASSSSAHGRLEAGDGEMVGWFSWRNRKNGDKTMEIKPWKDLKNDDKMEKW